MEKISKNRTILYSIIALILFTFLWFGTYDFFYEVIVFGKTVETTEKEYSIVVLGDSILGEYREADSITAQLEEQLGRSVFNGAMGGTSFARSDETLGMASGKDGISMAALAEAIVAENFGVQQTVRIQEAATEYFPEVIDELERIDFDKVDILIIEQGLNDYHAVVPLYDNQDLYNTYTFTGAIRNSLKILQEAYPDMRLILVTPTYTWYLARGLTCEEFNQGNGILEDYVEAQLLVAEEMGVEVIDLYHDFYSHETWEDWQLYTRDGMHPHEEGRRLITEKLVEYLTENP